MVPVILISVGGLLFVVLIVYWLIKYGNEGPPE